MGNHRICYPMTDVPEMYIETVTVPNGGLKPGDVVIVNAIDSEISNNFTQYAATKPTTSLLSNNELGIVISGGNYETLADGRMPKGNPDYTTYEYRAGQTAPVLILAPRVKFYLSDDCLATSATANKYLYGQDDSNTLVQGDSVPTFNLTVIKVQAKHNFRLGGDFGGDFATGNVCRVLPYVDNVDYYTVTFNSNGGSEVASQNVVEHGKATEPTPPTKSGYAFKGWYSDAGLTKTFNFNTPIDSNITLYAKWIETFDVTFNTDGGSSVATQTVESGSKATQPADPTKDGYIFDGWYAEDTFTTEFDFNAAITADTTVYAKWTEE